MIVYVVQAEVDLEVASAYETWLNGHIPEVLAAPGFVKAELLLDSDVAVAGRRMFCVHYYVQTQTDLENYLRDRAPALREDGLKRFPDRFTATRRVWLDAKTFQK